MTNRRVSSRSIAPRAVPRLIGCMVLGLLCVAPPAARAGCVAMAPGPNGVLRLDTGRAAAWPCTRPLRQAALPEAFAPSPSPALPRPSRRPAETAPPAAALPEPATTTAAPTPTAPAAAPAATAPTAVPAAPPAAAADVLRLKDETARLQEQLARLTDETAALRGETKRLRDQLARREAALPAPVTAAPDTRAANPKFDSRVGTVEGNARGADAPAAKGDLLAPGPTKDAAGAPSTAVAPAAKPSDQTEFERRKSLAERAWSDLLDFAARMKKDLSAKPE